MRPPSIGVSVGVPTMLVVSCPAPLSHAHAEKDTGRETTSLAPATTPAFCEVAILWNQVNKKAVVRGSVSPGTVSNVAMGLGYEHTLLMRCFCQTSSVNNWALDTR